MMMLGWHFLAADRTLHTGERVQVGGRYAATGPFCKNGMHASRRALDALTYAPGPVVCRVRLRGEILQGPDRAVACSRQVLWMADATQILYVFALSVAIDAMELTDTSDPRCWAALEVKARWLRGRATDQELAAARAAARNVPWAAVRDADWAAAENAPWAVAWAVAWAAAENAPWAAAWAVAWAAARAVAWAAARDTAEDTPWAAARDTAKDTPWAAARDAADDAYNFQLETMLTSLES